MKIVLEGVKPGDKLVCPHNIGQRIDIFRVERITKTLAVCGARSFALKDGKMRGTSSWNSRWARIPTDADLAQAEIMVRVRRAASAIQQIKVTSENLAAAEAFIAASQPKEPAK